MASETEIEALDSIANEIKLSRESGIELLGNITNEIKLFNETQNNNSRVSSEIYRGIQKVLAELHNDTRSMVILKEFWEQMNFFVAEKLVSQISYETYFSELAEKGLYFSQLTQNKDFVMNNTYPLTDLVLLPPYSGNASVDTEAEIPVDNLLSTIGHESEITLTSVSAGPGCTVFYNIDKGVVVFKGLSAGARYFVFTVTSTIGSSISTIANIQVA